MFRPSSTPLRCSRAREWVSLALDHQLDEAGTIRLATHLGECADCRQHQVVLERGAAALRAQVAEPSENFEWRVQLGIQRALREGVSDRERVAASFWRPALASAAAVAVVVIGLGSMWLLEDRAPGSLTVAGRDVAALPSSSPGPAATGSTFVAGSSTQDAVPDLSGAVPGKIFEFDATRDGFGIRTVSRTTADPRFSGDLYAPVREGRPAASLLESAGRIPLQNPMGIQWRRVDARTQLRADGVQVLNLRLHGSTLPAARAGSESSSVSSLSAASQR